MRRFDITIRPRTTGKTMHLIHEYFEHFVGKKVLFITPDQNNLRFIKDTLKGTKCMVYLDASKEIEQYEILLVDGLDEMNWVVIQDIIAKTNPLVIKATAGMEFLMKVRE